MAVSFRGVWSTSGGGSVVSGALSGDVCLLWISASQPRTFSPFPPSGWTAIRSTANGDEIGSERTWCYYRVATGSDSVSVTWSNGDDYSGSMSILAYSGVDTSSPFDTYANFTGTNLTTGTYNITAPSVTASVTNGMLVHLISERLSPASSFSTAAGMTNRGGAAGSYSSDYSQFFDRVITVSGATGAYTYNPSGGQQNGNGQHAQTIVLRAANTPPAAPTVTFPNGGERLNTTHTITWTAATDAETAQGSLQYHIQLSTNNGGAWNDIVALTSAGATSYSFNFGSQATTTQALIRIRAWDGALFGSFDQSNAIFSINHQTQQIMM